MRIENIFLRLIKDICVKQAFIAVFIVFCVHTFNWDILGFFAYWNIQSNGFYLIVEKLPLGGVLCLEGGL